MSCHSHSFTLLLAPLPTPPFNIVFTDNKQILLTLDSSDGPPALFTNDGEEALPVPPPRDLCKETRTWMVVSTGSINKSNLL